MPFQDYDRFKTKILCDQSLGSVHVELDNNRRFPVSLTKLGEVLNVRPRQSAIMVGIGRNIRRVCVMPDQSLVVWWATPRQKRIIAVAYTSLEWAGAMARKNATVVDSTRFAEGLPVVRYRCRLPRLLWKATQAWSPNVSYRLGTAHVGVDRGLTCLPSMWSMGNVNPGSGHICWGQSLGESSVASINDLENIFFRSQFNTDYQSSLFNFDSLPTVPGPWLFIPPYTASDNRYTLADFFSAR